MASHGRSGLQRWLLGSVAEKVLRATANPLMLVRATEATSSAAGKRLGPIIVPLDGSSVAELVLPTVTELAKSLASEVILFRAYNVPYGGYSVGGGSYAVDLPRLSAAVEADVQQYLEERRANLAAAGVAQLSFASKEGLAADAIIDYARNHHNGLIVMCSHGRTGVQRWALGSVTEAVARHAGNPVLILHAAS
jgi:nucleotide-binding universal stress UspA family protein